MSEEPTTPFPYLDTNGDPMKRPAFEAMSASRLRELCIEGGESIAISSQVSKVDMVAYLMGEALCLPPEGERR